MGFLPFPLIHRNPLYYSLDQKERVFCLFVFKSCYGLNWAPPQFTLKFQLLAPQNGTLLGNRVIADVISSVQMGPY